VATSSWKNALVIGASSGIGEEVARQLARAGTRVALVARRADALEVICDSITAETEPGRAVFRAHDVTDYEGTAACWDALEDEAGPFDLVVYAAGAMPVVELTEFTFEKDRGMVDVNVLGAMAWLNQAAVRLQARGGGTIVGVSSVAGDRGRAGQPAYYASKAALSTYLEALYNRLWRHGIRVVDVRPGPVHTPMTAHLEGLDAISAELAGQLILEAARSGRRVAYIPAKWRLIMFIIRSIPAFVLRRLKI